MVRKSANVTVLGLEHLWEVLSRQAQEDSSKRSCLLSMILAGFISILSQHKIFLLSELLILHVMLLTAEYRLRCFSFKISFRTRF